MNREYFPMLIHIAIIVFHGAEYVILYHPVVTFKAPV